MFPWNTKNGAEKTLGIMQILVGFVPIMVGATSVKNEDTAMGYVMSGLSLIAAGIATIAHSLADSNPSKQAFGQVIIGIIELSLAALIASIAAFSTSPTSRKLVFGAAAGLAAGGASMLTLGFINLCRANRDPEAAAILAAPARKDRACP